MQCYILPTDSVASFAGLVRWDPTHGFEGFDERVRPATVQMILRPALNGFMEPYTLILQDRGIEFLSRFDLKSLEAATDACGWFAVTGDDAPPLAQKLEGLEISEEDVEVVSFSTADDVLFDEWVQGVRELNQEFAQAVRQIGPSQVGLFRLGAV